MDKMPQKGFTLIEVLVALAIVAVAFLGVAGQFEHQVRMFEKNRDRVLAQWAAQNALATLQASKQWPELGTRSEQAILANRNWSLNRIVSPTPNNKILKIEYLLADQQAVPLGRFVGYLPRAR